MKYGLLLSISRALLLARWRQTLVAAMGVTFGITMFIGLLSFMSGLNDLLDGLILNRTPHIRLYNDVKFSERQPVDLAAQYKGYYNFVRSIKPKNERQSIHNNGIIIKTLKKEPAVLGVAPKIIAQVFYNIGVVSLTGIVNGIDPKEENELFMFQDYVSKGSYQNLIIVPNSIILGKGVAEKMLADIGDLIQITTTKGERIQLKVVGYFESGLQEIDKVQSYTTIATAQKLLGEPNSYITDIQIKLRDINMAPQLAKRYQKLFDVDAVDIQTANSQYETGSFIRSLISYSVGVTLLIVAGFGIYNILNMMIFEKMDSIAILKAMGFSGKDVKRIFIIIAAGIGIFGGVLGLILGFGLSVIIDHIPFNTPSLPTIKTYPVDYSIGFYMIGGIFSLLTTYLAGYFPARKASKMDPVVIIRGK